jgi:hypothetical protein
MARLKTQEDVALARIKADVERSRLKSQTIIWCFVIIAFVACVAIIAWAAVRITDKPAWLVFGLALLGAGGTPMYYAWRLQIRFNRAIDAIKADRTEGAVTKGARPRDRDEGRITS